MKEKSKIYPLFVYIILALFLFSSTAPMLHALNTGVRSNISKSSNQPAFSGGLHSEAMSPANYAVSFTESGLPTGTSWWVILAGNEISSTSGTITFQEPDGTYSYQVDNSPPNGVQYTVSPSSGTVSVYGFSSTNYIFYTVNYYLTVNANSQSDGTVSPSSGWYLAGETWTLIAIPNFGYSLSSWTGTGAGSYSGTSSSPSITLNGPITETANFYQQSYTVTFSESGLPSGTVWWVDLGGLNLSSSSPSINFNLPDGTYDYTVMDTSSDGVQYQTTSSGTVAVSGFSFTQYVYYNVNYYLTVLANPSASGTVSPGSGWYPAGDLEILSALPNSGYGLSYWTGSGSGSYSGGSSFPTVTMNGPITETAYFIQPDYGLTFQETGLPAGKSWWVTVDGQNKSSTSSSVSFSLPDGTYSYTLMDQGGSWAKYSPGVATGSVTVFGSGTTQYVYYTTSYYVGVYASPSQYGTVSPSTGWVYAGNFLFPSEIPNPGYAFSSWVGNGTGSYTGTNSAPSILVNGPFNETAHFYLPKYQVSFTESGLPSGTKWWVNVGADNTSATSSTIKFTLSDGTYEYAIGQEAPYGSMYTPGYTAGSVTVFGSSVTQNIFYTVQYHLPDS